MTILYEQWEHQAQLLAPMLGTDVTVVRSGQALAEAVAAYPDELLVVFGPSTALSEVVAFAERARTHRPALKVVLLRQHLDVSVMTEALRAGVYEVVATRDPDAMAQACARALAAAREVAGVNGVPVGQTAPGGRVVAVFSGKGGTGASMIATNLAVAFAADAKLRVCLVDLDLAFGDVAIMLGLTPERTIAAAVPVADRLDETGLRMLLTRHSSGVDTLLAPVQPADGEQVSRDLVAEILALARGMFDVIVVDCASVLSDQTLAALDAAHHYLLVTTPELPAIKSLRVTLDTFTLLDYQADRRVVVLNQADAKVGLSMADVERAIKVPVAAYIPTSRDVPVSINNGVPIVSSQPNHPVSVAIRDLAAKRFTNRATRPQPRRLRALVGRRTDARKG